MPAAITFSSPTKVAEAIEGYFQSGNINFLIGSGASAPAIALAGSIEAQINDLLAGEQFDEADELAYSFLCTLADANDDAIAGIWENESETVLASYQAFLSEIDSILFARKSAILARQANIFTTNYDTMVELAATQVRGVAINDGFDRGAGFGEALRLRPERLFDRAFRSSNNGDRLAEVPVINLIKLHGSLTWRRLEGIIVAAERPRPPAASTNSPADVRAALSQCGVILPNVRKFESTTLDHIYFDMLRLYATVLDRENTLLVTFGFSFADEHILTLTRRALRNPTLQIILCAHGSADVTRFETLFAEHRNVTLLKPEQGQALTFERLVALLRAIRPGSA